MVVISNWLGVALETELGFSGLCQRHKTNEETGSNCPRSKHCLAFLENESLHMAPSLEHATASSTFIFNPLGVVQEY